MRGKDKNDDFGVQQIRITPAYAGKRFRDNPYYIYHEDHPRLCGEKASLKYGEISKYGSPPPMRGKERQDLSFPHDRGITPAYAGKSSPAECVSHAWRDHPRLCGEKTKKIPKQRYFFHQPASFSFSLQYT